MNSILRQISQVLVIVVVATLALRTARAQEPAPAAAEQQPVSQQPVSQQPAGEQPTPAEPKSIMQQIAKQPTTQEQQAAAAAKLLDAFEKTKAAKTLDDWNNVIILCGEGINLATTQESIRYGKQLASWAHNRRGEELAKTGRDEDAMADFVTAIGLDPNNWRALHNRGVSLATGGKYDAALTDFNRALDLYRNYPNTWFNRAEIKYVRGDFTAAIQDYNQAIRLAPKDGAAYNSRGHALYRTGRYREALADFDQAVQLTPEEAAPYTHRGDLLADMGNYAEAVRDYRQAIRLNPKLGRAYQSIAWLMATCPDERYREQQFALEAAKKAIELDGEKDYRYLDTLAAALANSGQYGEAVQAEEKALAMAPAEDAPRFRQRLDRYKEGKPFRNGPRAATAPSNREYR